MHPYNKSGVEKHLCLHSSELYSIRHPCSVIPPPHLRSPTSLFMHYFFPFVFRGYFLLSSLTSVCPFSVLPSLKHLPLISRRHSKPFFSPFVHLKIHCLLPSYGLLLPFSLQWSRLHAVFHMRVRNGRALPTRHKESGPAVTSVMKFSSKGSSLFKPLITSLVKL